MTRTNQNPTMASLLLPGALLAALLATISWQTGTLERTGFAGAAAVVAPQTTKIAPRAFRYRAAGSHQRQDGRIMDAPMVNVAHPGALEIMTHQVTVGEYRRCVAAKACAGPHGKQVQANHPVTGVSFNDATAYANWLSAATGANWRLPSVEEWNFAAAEKAVDPALGLDDNGESPADRWLAAYEREAGLGRTKGLVGPVGSGGTNSMGLADLAGAVWEWTSTCDSRTTLDGEGKTAFQIESCGVRLLEGQHRTPMSSFIRDARTGGCTTGRPPDALGFRLVKVPGIMDRALDWLGARLGVPR